MKRPSLLSMATVYLGACLMFTALMSWSTAGREQEAWITAAALLSAPAILAAAAWATVHHHHHHPHP